MGMDTPHINPLARSGPALERPSHEVRAEIREKIAVLEGQIDALKAEEKEISSSPRMKEFLDGLGRILRGSALPLGAAMAIKESFVLPGPMGILLQGVGVVLAGVTMVGSGIFGQDVVIGIKKIASAIKGGKPYQLNADEYHTFHSKS